MSKRNKVSVRDIWKKMFPADATKFLDIGCADGSETMHLIADGKEVVGVEIMEEQAAIARKRLTCVFTADAQNLSIPYEDGYFDCLIYGGVIGAFRETVNALKSHAVYLKPNGYLVAHVPNIRFYKVLHMLLFKGVWDEMPDGILYYPYVRHFTLTNIYEIFLEAGYKIEETAMNNRGNIFLRLLNFLCLNKLEEFLVYEYVLKARKIGEAEKVMGVVKRKRVVF